MKHYPYILKIKTKDIEPIKLSAAQKKAIKQGQRDIVKGAKVSNKIANLQKGIHRSFSDIKQGKVRPWKNKTIPRSGLILQIEKGLKDVSQIQAGKVKAKSLKEMLRLQN
jgi:hypothetical protein